MAVMLAPGTLQTARLALVPLGLDEAAAMVNGHRPPDALWALGYPSEQSLVAAGLVVAAEQAGRSLGAFGTYQVVRTEDQVVVGDVGFLGPPDDAGTVQILIGISSSMRGRGYGAEALRALLDWACARPGVEQVLSDTSDTNLPGIRVMERAGMRHLATEDGLVVYSHFCPGTR